MKPDELLADVGRGEVRSRQLEQAVRSLDPRADPPAAGVRDDAPTLAARKAAARSAQQWRPGRGRRPVADGAGEMLQARAAGRHQSDSSRAGRGVTIHRASCASLKRLDAGAAGRRRMGRGGEATFPVDIEVRRHESHRAAARNFRGARARERSASPARARSRKTPWCACATRWRSPTWRSSGAR